MDIGAWLILLVLYWKWRLTISTIAHLFPFVISLLFASLGDFHFPGGRVTAVGNGCGFGTLVSFPIAVVTIAVRGTRRRPVRSLSSVPPTGVDRLGSARKGSAVKLSQLQLCAIVFGLLCGPFFLAIIFVIYLQQKLERSVVSELAQNSQVIESRMPRLWVAKSWITIWAIIGFIIASFLQVGLSVLYSNENINEFLPFPPFVVIGLLLICIPFGAWIGYVSERSKFLATVNRAKLDPEQKRYS
jgi:hypothetical protein